MCTTGCLAFGKGELGAADVTGKSVLEVGSRVVNVEEISLRPHIEALHPASYLGVDIIDGPGVDEIASVYEIADRYGAGAFDVVVSTEVVEHVRDWRSAFHNLKAVAREGGVLLVTTRSPGFPYHGYPHDYWRYSQRDIRVILSDMEIQALANDPESPGVFVKAEKPRGFVEAGLQQVELFSIIGRKRRRTAPSALHAGVYSRLLHVRRKLRP